MTTATARLGEQLGRRLVLARLAAGDMDFREVKRQADAAIAIAEQLRKNATEIEVAYLDVVTRAAALGIDAVRAGRSAVAYDSIDLIHNVGELWSDRVVWDHGFFLRAFADAFLERHAAAVGSPVHQALLQLRAVTSPNYATSCPE